MAHKITDNCVACGTCESQCPQEAISAGDPKYIINPKKCTDCKKCVDACPVGAIEPA